MNRIFRAALLVLASATSAPAQEAPALSRTPGDTLRYREVTSSVTTYTIQGRPMELRQGHDAVLAVAFTRGDTARAWYESLALSLQTPQGAERPATGEALRRPFTLLVSARGRTTTLAVPEFPASFRGITDLAWQFFDFFPRLPDRPLTPGLAWSDTVEAGDTAVAEGSGRVLIRSYRVRGDSVVDGERVVVIEATGRTPLPASSRRNGRALGVESSDEGLIFFAPASGRFVGREMRGARKGVVEAASGEVEVAGQYTTRISRVP